jgi:hypothetical protein
MEIEVEVEAEVDPRTRTSNSNTKCWARFGQNRSYFKQNLVLNEMI